jgi:hypothetical protein
VRERERFGTTTYGEGPDAMVEVPDL